MSQRTIRVAPVRKTIRVEVPQAHAFEVFTSRIGRWWPATHKIGPVAMRDAVIEMRAGGRWYERGVDGSETEWGRVLAWDPPARLLLSWHLNSRFAIDEHVRSEVEVRFVPAGARATVVELEHRVEAPDAEQIRAIVDSENGWSMLLGRYSGATATAVTEGE